jgi:hypothetical protein
MRSYNIHKDPTRMITYSRTSMGRSSMSRFSQCVEVKWKSRFCFYIFLIKTYLWVELLCVEFFDVSKFFHGPYRINLVQFTTNKAKSFDYFDTFDLEPFFTTFLAAKTISDQLYWQVLITQPSVQTAFVCV